MKPAQRHTLLVILLAAIVFDRLFWQQSIGVNLALFAILVAVLHVVELGWRGLSAPARVAMLGALVAAVMVVVHGSIIATVACITSIGVTTAFCMVPSMRSIAHAGAQWIMNLGAAPLGLLESMPKLSPDGSAVNRGWRTARIALLPMIVMIVFFLLYSGGNSRFNSLTAGFLGDLFTWLGDVLEELFTPHVIFLLFGLAVSASLLLRSLGPWFAEREATFRDGLERVRVRRPKWMHALDMGALDREHWMAVVLLSLVNGLLLVVNAIDVHWIWFGFTVEPGMSLKEFVHEGMWLLIISMLLSMGILLRLFRRNLNFHPRRNILVLLASAWLIQNFILGISVFLRNYHYIGFHGLAYRRIGVIVFLALVLVGLITLFIKVRTKRSFFHLLRVNGWAAFVMMTVLACVDWDSTIVRYNLGHWNQGQIDVDNYLAMSDKVLPLLFADRDRVREQMHKHMENEVRWVESLDPSDFDRRLEQRRSEFMERYASQDWQSWTYADERTEQALERMPTR